MARFIFDFGNARGKWFRPGVPDQGDFPHAIANISETDWNRSVGAGKPPQGLIRVNGIPYAVGDAARRHTLKERPKGAARYIDTYYGVGLCFALAEAFADSENISLYASHAPQDQIYTSNLIGSSKRDWCVESYRGSQTFKVEKVTPFDEPLGGYTHLAFTKRGDERPNNPVADKTALIIDVGGYTTDHAIIDPGGAIDMLSIGSTRTGTIAAIDQFEQDLRRNNTQHFKEAGDLDICRVEAAIIKGVYQFGRIELNCRHEALEAIRVLVNDVIQIINAAGGAANFDIIPLTGGGGALIYDQLIAAFPSIEFVMVESDRELMKYANVFGGAKIATLVNKAG